jgi:hypothetical protein
MSDEPRKGAPEVEIWIVDRVEQGIAVLVEAAGPEDEEDEALGVVEVDAGLLGEHAEEGAVLLVPLGEVGEPMWEHAERDSESEEDRRREAESLLKRLKKRDPGGDVAL